VLTSQRYSEKADVYSFGMVSVSHLARGCSPHRKDVSSKSLCTRQVMWECLTREIPFEGLSALTAAMNVATLGQRPDMPAGTDPSHAALIRDCWAAVPDQRPSFASIVERLERIAASPPSSVAEASAAPRPAMASRVEVGKAPTSESPSSKGSISQQHGMPLVGRGVCRGDEEATVSGHGQEAVPVGASKTASAVPLSIPTREESEAGHSAPQRQSAANVSAGAGPLSFHTLHTSMATNALQQQPPRLPQFTPRGQQVWGGSGSSAQQQEHGGLLPLVGPPPRGGGDTRLPAAP